MPVLNERDFDSMANRVVSRFLSRQASLEEAAADEARDHQLNPDQIERLVQNANTATFLRMMDDRKSSGASDLMHEFDPIDSSRVIRVIIKATGDSPPEVQVHDSAASSDGCDDLPDEMSRVRSAPADSDDDEDEDEDEDDEDDEDEDEGEDDEDEGDDKRASYETLSTNKKHLAAARLRKLAEYMADQRQQLEFVFEEKFAALVDRFRGAYSRDKYAAFETDALIDGGVYSAPIINSVRAALRMEPLAAGTGEKMASLRDHHVSFPSKELEIFDELCKLAAAATRLSDAGTYLKGKGL